MLDFLCREWHSPLVLRDEDHIMTASGLQREFTDTLRVRSHLITLLELEAAPTIAGFPHDDAPSLLLQLLCIIDRTHRIRWTQEPAPPR